uniref:Dynein light chain n=1 Tax=Hucho hucho TaxID=62062 RepID=A0A4W5QVD4_9TELE
MCDRVLCQLHTHITFCLPLSGSCSCEIKRPYSGDNRRWKIRATMSDRKAVIKNADMSEEMQQDAVECATQALEKYNIEKDIAAYIKKEFDKKYNPTWHCIVGRNFGSYVTHETKHFIYFYLGQVAILLFKSG